MSARGPSHKGWIRGSMLLIHRRDGLEAPTNTRGCEWLGEGNVENMTGFKRKDAQISVAKLAMQSHAGEQRG